MRPVRDASRLVHEPVRTLLPKPVHKPSGQE